jgi:hypothetical protein
MKAEETYNVHPCLTSKWDWLFGITGSLAQHFLLSVDRLCTNRELVTTPNSLVDLHICSPGDL